VPIRSLKSYFGRTLRLRREMDIEYLMSNNFAFGGINTSIIFKRVRD
jgi:3-oxoacyl-(acyl-carrier-protein) synthase